MRKRWTLLAKVVMVMMMVMALRLVQAGGMRRTHLKITIG